MELDRGLFRDEANDNIGCGSYGWSPECGRGIYSRGSAEPGESSRAAKCNRGQALAVSLFDDMETGMGNFQPLMVKGLMNVDATGGAKAALRCASRLNKVKRNSREKAISLAEVGR